MDLNLNGKHAMVCGSTQGIGRATAEELAELGATVTLVARNEQSLKEVAASLPAPAGQSHDYVAADFDHPDELKKSLDAYLRSSRTIHILVNNSGGPPGGPVSDATLDEFTLAFNRHLACNHILVKAVLAGMKSAGYGRIINIISTSVKQPIAGLGVSNTIRGAVASWAKTLAGEVAGFGITVNNVLPGSTKTGRLDSLIESKAKKRGVSIETITDEMIAEVPAGRFASAREVGSAVAFLASPAASYINGINLPVDGGRLGSF